jgi:di/tripeptidase
MLYEYRSDNRNCLAKMEDMFRKVIEAYQAMSVDVEVELVGDRPCAGNVDPEAQKALESLSVDSIRRVTGCEPQFFSGSTDCNIPLSVGIPSVCLGLCHAKGAHTRTETLYLSSLPNGSNLCMDFMCHFFA